MYIFFYIRQFCYLKSCVSNTVISLIVHAGTYNMSEELPNPRSLSIHLFNDEDSIDQAKTMMMAYWAIFIGHDLSQTVASTMGKHIQLIIVYIYIIYID